MRIAVIGAGNIGGALARKWAAAGHQVTLGLRDPNNPKARQLVNQLGPGARSAAIGEAIVDADVVAFAIPGKSMAETVSSLGAELDGKIVIDATNNIGASSFNSCATISAAAPRASVYRAFNIYGWENFDSPGYGGQSADLLYAGADGDGRAQVEQLISDVGLRPVCLGGLDKVGLVDSILPLWFTLATEGKLGRHFAFKIVSS
jgi:8-hydroxy-5-deazaflavin:NADPH oxidoreductase